MKQKLSDERVAIFDDFLSAKEVEQVRNFAEHEAALKSVHTQHYLRVYRYDDGHPLTSATVVTGLERKGKRVRPTMQGTSPNGPIVHSYPSDCALDVVIAKLLRFADRWTPWLGTPAVDCKTLSAQLFVHPVGTSVGWHDDGGDYSGAFTYYVHPRWELDWGGELLVVDPKDDTYGRFVAAVPNRLVLLKAGTLHRVHKVTTCAGGNARMAVAGFFQKPSIAERAESYRCMNEGDIFE